MMKYDYSSYLYFFRKKGVVSFIVWRWIKNIYIYIYWTHLFYKYLKVGATKSDTSIYNTWGREENIRNKWRNFDIKYLGKLSTTFPGKLGNTYKSRWSPIFSFIFGNKPYPSLISIRLYIITKKHHPSEQSSWKLHCPDSLSFVINILYFKKDPWREIRKERSIYAIKLSLSSHRPKKFTSP